MKKLNKQNGITLIALIITIIVMLILVAVTTNMAINGGLFEKAGQATGNTKNAMNEEQALANGQIIIDGKTYASIDEYFNGTSFAMFDTGTNVITKMYALASEGVMQWWYVTNNIAIDKILKYEGTPDLTKMTEANIVSWTDGYKAFEQEPDKYKNIVPEGYELCPIYMWFEESENEEIRNINGEQGLTEITDANKQRKVKTGTIYWWSKSKNVYLNPDSSKMFGGLPYVSDLSGLSTLKTDYVTNMEAILCVVTSNKKLKNLDFLARWNTENVENLGYAFCGYEALDNINGVSNWNTSNVTNMKGLCGGDPDIAATKNYNIDAFKNWNVSNVKDMSYMFYHTTATNLDAISNWDVSNVTNMQNMFGSSHVENLNGISNWNVNNVDSMNSMFYNCQNLTDASGINDWNIKSDCNFSNMFFNCSTHPNFTKVTGTWDENGTFLPN